MSKINDAKVYRVVDVQAEEEAGTCYLYTRTSIGHRKVFKLRASFEIILGSDLGDEKLSNYVMNELERYSDKIVIKNEGRSATYRRKGVSLLRLICDSFKTYTDIHKKVRYDKVRPKPVFICNDYETTEDCTLHYYGIYACLYVKESENGKKLVPAEPHEEFYYSPRVASFDFEMTSLNVINVESEPYVASYYFLGTKYVIYSSKYLPVDLESVAKYKFIKASDNTQVVKILINLIIKTEPDVLLGYNIYFADIPIIYHTLRRDLYQMPIIKDSPRIHFHNTKKIDKKNIQSEQGINIKFPGVNTIDMYIYLTRTLPPDRQEDLKLGTVGKEYLNVSKDPLTYKDLERIHRSGTDEEKMKVMKYCSKDSEIVTKLYEHFNVWNFHSGMTSTSGIMPHRILSKGNVEVIYGACDREARLSNTYMDPPNSKIFKPSGGLVLDPLVGLHFNVLCIDLTSMYPNIAIQHNIDAISVFRIGDASELERYQPEDVSYYRVIENGKVDVLMDGWQIFYGFTKNRVGILPNVLRKLLEDRKAIRVQKEAAEKEGDNAKARQLSGEEQAKKVMANSGCGALAEQSEENPMSFCVLNDIITTTGQCLLFRICSILRSLPNTTVIYGDTDSIFLTYKGDIKEVLSMIHEDLPTEMRFKVEYKADMFLINKKKHYIVKTGKDIKISGFKACKSGACEAVRSTFKKFVEILFNEGPIEATNFYNSKVEEYDNNKCVKDFSFKYSYKGKNYAPNCYRAKIRDHMKQRGVELIPGNLLDVVVVMTHENYIRRYDKEPKLKLPRASRLKSELMYTVEEVGKLASVIDVRAAFKSQCDHNVSSILSAYYSDPCSYVASCY
jgi:DNA polymerase elongation subunit (family B)